MLHHGWSDSRSWWNNVLASSEGVMDVKHAVDALLQHLAKVVETRQAMESGDTDAMSDSKFIFDDRLFAIPALRSSSNANTRYFCHFLVELCTLW